MELKMVCGSWMKEEDAAVLEVLRESPGWLTPEELAERTGLPVARTRRALALLRQQMRLSQAREGLSEE